MEWEKRWYKLEPLDSGGQATVFKVLDKSKIDIDKVKEELIKLVMLHPKYKSLQDMIKEYSEPLRRVIVKIIEAENNLNQGALKIYDMTKSAKHFKSAEKRLEREIKVMSKNLHPNLLEILNYDEDEYKWFVSRYYPKGSLEKNNNINVFKGDIIKSLKAFRPLVEGVSILHKHINEETNKVEPIIHRDIKHKNVFLDDFDNLILGDFGIVFFEDDYHDRISETFENVGTKDWMPTYARNVRIDDAIPQFDVYSLGKLLYYMITGIVLPHRYFNDSEDHANYALDKIFPNDEFVHFVKNILGKCLVDKKKESFNDASEQLESIDNVLLRIDTKNDWSDPDNLKLLCKICGVGEYKVIFTKGKTNIDMQSLGLIDGGYLYKVFRCDYCGNIQFFNKMFSGNIPKAWLENT